MRTRKLVVAVTLVALVGSDFALAMSPAFGQTSGPGNGRPLMPSLGDGAYGRVLPGPSTMAPYAVPQQPQQMFPPTQPQMIQRPVGPSAVSVCQPGGGLRPYQTVSIPRTRTPEPLQLPQPPTTPQPPAATVTQVTVSQSAPGTQAPVSRQPGVETRAPSGNPPLAAPEVEEFSRIEASFNLEPMRVYQIGSQQPQQLQPRSSSSKHSSSSRRSSCSRPSSDR